MWHCIHFKSFSLCGCSMFVWCSFYFVKIRIFSFIAIKYQFSEHFTQIFVQTFSAIITLTALFWIYGIRKVSRIKWRSDEVKKIEQKHEQRREIKVLSENMCCINYIGIILLHSYFVAPTIFRYFSAKQRFI